jgi:hypothetical protein
MRYSPVVIPAVYTSSWMNEKQFFGQVEPQPPHPIQSSGFTRVITILVV